MLIILVHLKKKCLLNCLHVAPLISNESVTTAKNILTNSHQHEPETNIFCMKIVLIFYV